MHQKYQEKLSQIKRMISLANINKQMTEDEVVFIKNFGKMIGVKQADIDSLLLDPSFEEVYPKNEDERIFFFQSLVLLMGIDGLLEEEEKNFLRELSIHLGLNPMSTENIIARMQDYPNFMIPEEELVQIYKTSYN